MNSAAEERAAATRSAYRRGMENASRYPPDGLRVERLRNPKLIAAALEEADAIFDDLAASLGADLVSKLSHLRFTINTACPSRNSDDPAPLYRWEDPRARHLCKAVSHALRQFGAEFSPLLNVVVRRYSAGDMLAFHVDRQEFGEHACGLVLENGDPARGLMLRNGDEDSHAFVWSETPGTAWRLSGDARWIYQHGYANSDEPGAPVRTAVTFEFYQSEQRVPLKPFQ